MKKFRYWILPLLLLAAFRVFAQTPGYMGKRFVLGYGLYASPRLSASGGSPGVNLMHEGFLEFAMKKNVSVGFSARFYNTMYANTRNVNALNYYSSYVSQDDKAPHGFTTIKGRNYSLYFKLYKHGFVAPWGRYFLIGPTLYTFETTYDPENMYVTVSSRDFVPYGYQYYSDFGLTTQSYKRLDLTIGWGRNRIIADRITLDYGYTINVIAMTAAAFDAFDEDVLDNDLPGMGTYIEKTSAARIRSVNRFNVFLKVGVLLF